MPTNKLKVFISITFWLTCICIILGLKNEERSAGINNALQYFKENADLFSSSSLELKKAVSLLSEQDTATLVSAKMALKESRSRYKRIAFFLDYFFESSAMIYNRPAKVEVDEPYMEYQEPAGFQVIESLLFSADPYQEKSAIAAQCEVISSSAADLNSLLYGFSGNDAELMESTRLELIRVITLSITGYDAPELKSGITESYQSVLAIQSILKPYFADPSVQTAQLSATFDSTLNYIKGHPDFDSFNRMEFITDFALPLQEQLNGFIVSLRLDLNQKSALNYSAKNIFSRDAMSLSAFSGLKVKDSLLAVLGKKLFFEKALSGNLRRNCADCHRPDHFFAEELKTSRTLDGKSNVLRNAPTLLYSAFQYAQFWDGRAKTLQEQIRAVIANPQEMNGDHALIVTELKVNKEYQRQFAAAFSTDENPVSTNNLADALAAYVATLAPFNSAFDQYIDGNKQAMSTAQIKGFNLFMGKAQCGSCHFAPLFNGLIPPFYKLTEYETLGTPENEDFKHLKKDKDPGRFGYFPIIYYQSAFKTPTVRNTAKTAPYMHNGVFSSLEKVMDFYNQGGGAGLQMDVPQQTLSSKHLSLSDREVKDIIEFMQSLTDKM